jgi:hypothetical protein
MGLAVEEVVQVGEPYSKGALGQTVPVEGQAPEAAMAVVA